MILAIQTRERIRVYLSLAKKARFRDFLRSVRSMRKTSSNKPQNQPEMAGASSLGDSTNFLHVLKYFGSQQLSRQSFLLRFDECSRATSGLSQRDLSKRA